MVYVRQLGGRAYNCRECVFIATRCLACLYVDIFIGGGTVLLGFDKLCTSSVLWWWFCTARLSPNTKVAHRTLPLLKKLY